MNRKVQRGKHSSIPMACSRTLLFNGNSCIHMLCVLCLVNNVVLWIFRYCFILSSAIWVKIVKWIIKYLFLLLLFFLNCHILCCLPFAFFLIVSVTGLFKTFNLNFACKTFFCRMYGVLFSLWSSWPYIYILESGAYDIV